MNNDGLMFLQPVFKEMIWGGSRLATEFGYDIPGDDTGECWGISAHPNGDCTVRSGEYSGMKLSQVWSEHPELFGREKAEGVFPLLTKIIDAKADLSIQVHPSDDYAKVHENGSLGKTECWYILDCPEGATLVVGHNAADKEECAKMIHEGRWSEFIREVPVHKGDFVSIVPGTVHAIKAGVMLLETQQNSDITYRVYDYDRLSGGKPRELHVKQSMDVITVPAKPVSDSVFNVSAVKANELSKLISCKYYDVYKLDVEGKATIDISDNPFTIMSVVSGEGSIDGHVLTKGDHFILPCGYDTAEFEGCMEIIASTVAVA